MKKRMRTLVIGDIHGALKALIQVLYRADFDYKNDRLIVLGDVADGWPEVMESFEHLINNVKNLVYVYGNHDSWLKHWLKEGKTPNVWTMQGGMATINSYEGVKEEIKKKHLKFLQGVKCYFIDEKNRVYVHGGIDTKKHPADTDKMYLLWDRRLWDSRNSLEKLPLFREVYVGHTSIYRFSHKPLNYANVWFMDTGGGWEGVLSLIDVDTKEVWQSDVVSELYLGELGRN